MSANCPYQTQRRGVRVHLTSNVRWAAICRGPWVVCRGEVREPVIAMCVRRCEIQACKCRPALGVDRKSTNITHKPHRQPPARPPFTARKSGRIHQQLL
ncbi:uncharacterized protein B0H18DRAFT_359520 [Fomitopsis serialis]|uniref:uncharacterized protein n=1 Tax=Fomitopsis serialis TaxID=139415 RepID=UPI0020089201|nr:uncharacterized protein B0H18DRAFT_359520 [Neoantrodia serialis]KAH9925996.1 hypothetical protein B0H18DRAFT_359520 [Neoantrodia serialis]